MMEKIRISEREVAAMRKTIVDNSSKITRANQNRIRLEKEKNFIEAELDQDRMEFEKTNNQPLKEF